MIFETYESPCGKLCADYMKGYVLLESTNKIQCHEFYEILLMERGQATYSSNDGVVKVGDKTLIFTKAREVHNPYTQSTPMYERYKIAFYPEFFKGYLDGNASISDIIASSYKKPLEDGDFFELKTYFKRIFDSLKSGKCDNLALSTFLMCILIRGKEAEMRTEDNETNYVSDVVDYIKQNFSTHLTIDGIASKFFVSRGKLIYDFKEYANMSISGYVTVTRIEAAKELLLQGYSVGFVGERCGFSSPSYFIKVFSEITKMTPLKFQAKFYKKD